MNFNRKVYCDVDDEITPTADVRVNKNQVYFYGDITTETVLELVESLTKLEKELLNLQVDYHLEKPPNIYLHINSGGGDAFAGLSAMSTIENLKVPVICIADGLVASAATFLLLGATGGRMIRRNSCILIHQIRTEFWGKYADLKDELKNSEIVMKKIAKIYKSKSRLPMEKIESLLKKELYLSDKRCVRYGLVDSIL